MPRPQAYRRDEVVTAAKDAFWQTGYQATAIADLQSRTGLSRSSLYSAFGDKRTLFSVALDRYIDSFIDPLLHPVEEPSAGIGSIVTFFGRVREVLLEDLGRARNGCLIVNTIAEMSGRDEDATERVTAYRDRLRRDFLGALAGSSRGFGPQKERIRQRADMLVAATLGVWLLARIDPTDAAAVCAEIAREVESWAQDMG